jgi:beta-ketoacyl-acyl-carrier-protein synthase II
MERVVVTGVGVASPLGCNVADFWSGLLEGRSGVVALGEGFDDLRTHIGARVTDYKAEDHFSHREARRMSRASQLAMVAAAEAISQACLTSGGVDPVETAVIIGSSIGGFAASDPFFRDYYLKGQSSPLVIPISMNHGPSAHVSLRYGLQGPLMTVDAACASSAHSIGYAFYLIRSGALQVAVTGGADSPFARGVMEAWCSMRAMSERNDCPAEACRPFSADRDGLVLGEGSGVVILEAESSALRRGATILGEVLGYGATGDSYHLTLPTTDGPARAMRKALADAGLRPEQIDYINAHGTATVSNDKNETAAIKEVFGDHAYRIPVVSNKAALGHSIGASGALEFISCLHTLRDQVVPPTINYHVLDPECDLDYVTEGKRAHRVQLAMNNSFAFGGSNAVVVLGAYAPRPGGQGG